ncbi:MAG: hypothetical protein KGL11_13125 [Alphaproteobacteria bacterium]|nr:hypothetical protein [Alphaproteobacteria bacterium]
MAVERVSTPVERMARDAIRKIEGTGFGLALTRGLVRLRGGAIMLRRREFD